MLMHSKYHIPKQITYLRYQVLKQKRSLHAVLNVSPSTRCQEQENQACYLTKTLVRHELPTTFDKRVNIPTEERDAICAAVKKCIIETNYFHRDEAPVFPKRWTAHRKAYNMEKFKAELSQQVLLNMLKIVWAAKCSKDIPADSRTLTYRSDLVAPWVRFGKKIQVSGKHGHLVSGKTLLGLFADEGEVSETNNEVIDWTDVISPFFDLHEVNALYKANRGFYTGSPYPCPQTLMVINPLIWKPRFNSGNGVFFSFAHAMTYALSQGEEMGKDLVNPVPMQCIVFNGCSFYFVCYQLNTLNFSDDNQGIKNMAWIVSDQRLYDQVTDKLTESLEQSEAHDFIEYTSKRMSLVDFDRKRLSETLNDDQTRKVYIEGFNRAPVDMFINFLLHPST